MMKVVLHFALFMAFILIYVSVSTFFTSAKLILLWKLALSIRRNGGESVFWNSQLCCNHLLSACVVTTHDMSAFCPQTKVQYRRWLSCPAIIRCMKIWSWKSWKCLRSAVCLFSFPLFLSSLYFPRVRGREEEQERPWPQHKGHGQTGKDRVAFRRWMFCSIIMCSIMENMLIHFKSLVVALCEPLHAPFYVRSVKMWSTCDQT